MFLATYRRGETDGTASWHDPNRAICRLKALPMELMIRYSDGQEVRLGDRIKLGEDEGGIVVCSIDTGEYTDEHSEAQWGYLKKGVMINFPKYGLIHFVEPDEDLQLIARTDSSRS